MYGEIRPDYVPPNLPMTLDSPTFDGPSGAMDGIIEMAKTRNGMGSMDEPVKDTIMRDVNAIVEKLKYVVSPRARDDAGSGLRDWDLWGPLFLCLILSITLWLQASDQKQLVFSLVYVVVWLGAVVVTLNALLLGGNISFFQSVCVLGYCIFPIDVAAILCAVLPWTFIRLIIVGCALYLSTGASSRFMAQVVKEEKKWLALYPVFLFYVSLGWLVLLI